MYIYIYMYIHVYIYICICHLLRCEYRCISTYVVTQRERERTYCRMCVCTMLEYLNIDMCIMCICICCAFRFNRIW